MVCKTWSKFHVSLQNYSPIQAKYGSVIEQSVQLTAGFKIKLETSKDFLDFSTFEECPLICFLLLLGCVDRKQRIVVIHLLLHPCFKHGSVFIFWNLVMSCRQQIAIDGLDTQIVLPTSPLIQKEQWLLSFWVFPERSLRFPLVAMN